MDEYAALRRPGSAHPDVYVHRDVFTALREDGAAALPCETIGLLYGRSWQDPDGPWLVVNRYVTALPDEKECSPGHSSLTAEGNARLRRRSERRFPTEECLGWAHTHTGPEPEFSAGDRQQQQRKSAESVGLLAHCHGADDWRFTGYVGPDAEPLTGGPLYAPQPPHARAVVVVSGEPPKVHAVSAPPEAPVAGSGRRDGGESRGPLRRAAAQLRRRLAQVRGAGMSRIGIAVMIGALLLTAGGVGWLILVARGRVADDRPARAPATSATSATSGMYGASPSAARADRQDTAVAFALVRYRAFWDVLVRASKAGGKRSPELARYGTPRLLAVVEAELAKGAKDRAAFSDKSRSSPYIDLDLGGRPAMVVIGDCVGPAGKRFVVTALAVFDPERGWLIDLFAPHRERSC